MKTKPRFCEFKRCRGFGKLPGRFEIRINGTWRATCVLCCAMIDRRFPNCETRNVLLPGELMAECKKCYGYHSLKEKCSKRFSSSTDILQGKTLTEFFNQIRNIALVKYPHAYTYSQLHEIENI